MTWFCFSFVIILLLQMFLQKSILMENSLLLIHSFICFAASTVVLYMEQWGFLVKCCIEVTLPHVFICFSVTAFSEAADLCGMFRITVANGELKLLKSKVIKCCFLFFGLGVCFCLFWQWKQHFLFIFPICIVWPPSVLNAFESPHFHTCFFSKFIILYQIFISIHSPGLKKVKIPSNFIVS